MMWPVATATTSSFQSRTSFFSLTAGATTAAAAWYNYKSNNTLLEAAGEKTDRTTHHDKNKNPIEINLMDKIASKVYLNPSRVRRNHETNQNNRNSPYSSSDAIERPVGVPSRLRILAIDLPEMRQEAFSKGTCRVALDRVFPDGIAPSKKIEGKSGGDGDGTTSTASSSSSSSRKNDKSALFEVEQKAFVRSLVRCFQDDLPDKLGVEMMEASFAALNPKNLRKTRQLGGYHYDPGKYSHVLPRPDADSSSSSSSPPKNDHGDHTNHRAATGSTANESVPPEEQQVVQEEDELEAPWNQYAWIEELTLRVHGHLHFGDSLESTSRWNRYLTGNIFKQTVPSRRSVLELLLPPFWQSDPEGVDGGGTTSTARSSSNNRQQGHRNNHNWASNKPHAVIANGAAIQRVPNGLRLLQKTCKDANVPLFVLYDPRAWGGNTHQNLHQALRDVRFTVKQNIILQAMEQQSGFSRGRRVGRIERQIEYLASQARQDRQRRQEAIRRRQWDKLDAVALEKRLIEHGVIRKEDRLEEQGARTYRYYTPALMEIARQCVADEAEQHERKYEQVQEQKQQQQQPVLVSIETDSKNDNGISA